MFRVALLGRMSSTKIFGVTPPLFSAHMRGAFMRRHYSVLAAESVEPIPEPSSSLQPHAVISSFDLLKIGIGPSSSHTVGPMRAARLFGMLLENCDSLRATAQMRIDIYGSLALTGDGHGTPKAILMGMEGETPHEVNTETIESRVQKIYHTHQLNILGKHVIPFNPSKQLVFHMTETLPAHPNGMRFSAFNSLGDLLIAREYYSVGGGFIVAADDVHSTTKNAYNLSGTPQHLTKRSDGLIPFQFTTAHDLISICESQNMTISNVVFTNERVWRSDEEITAGILNIWRIMSNCIQDGCLSTQTILPGRLNIKRRAPLLYRKLLDKYHMKAVMFDAPRDTKQWSSSSPSPSLPLSTSSFTLDWLSCFAIAVNEENAAGCRVVTAPTNGAAGVIPAVLKYHSCFSSTRGDADILNFLLTASAIGMLYKRGASISAAEMGCQGEIGVASSMAAAGLAAVMGGSIYQIENAAEIAMEHSLGLTCDPVGGLVQIPCIERNAMGAAKAYTAAQLALNGDGTHKVSLDQVIETMRQTGHDMQHKYKETSLGGLAVNVPLC